MDKSDGKQVDVGNKHVDEGEVKKSQNDEKLTINNMNLEAKVALGFIPEVDLENEKSEEVPEEVDDEEDSIQNVDELMDEERKFSEDIIDAVNRRFQSQRGKINSTEDERPKASNTTLDVVLTEVAEAVTGCCDYKAKYEKLLEQHRRTEEMARRLSTDLATVSRQLVARDKTMVTYMDTVSQLFTLVSNLDVAPLAFMFMTICHAFMESRSTTLPGRRSGAQPRGGVCLAGAATVSAAGAAAAPAPGPRHGARPRRRGHAAARVRRRQGQSEPQQEGTGSPQAHGEVGQKSRRIF